MIGLLDAATRLLRGRGMSRMFVDGVRGAEEGFTSLGTFGLLPPAIFAAD